MKSSYSIKNLTAAAMFAAITFILTYFHTPMPNANGGYVHLGDCAIFLAASILPLPYAIISASVGGGLCDLLSGFAIWAPATVVIKALIAVCFTSKKDKILCKQNYIALLLTLFITVLGYYIAEAIIYGNWATPLASVIGNVVQWLGSIVLYVIISVSLDRINFKQKLF